MHANKAPPNELAFITKCSGVAARNTFNYRGKAIGADEKIERETRSRARRSETRRIFIPRFIDDESITPGQRRAGDAMRNRIYDDTRPEWAV